MIILSQVEPILEPLVENQLWYLPQRNSNDSSRNTLFSMKLMNRPGSQRQIDVSSPRGYIPPFEYRNRYLQFLGLPQFIPEEIEIKLNKDNRQVCISGKLERNNEMEFETFEFTKRILIPTGVDMDQMKCSIADNGLLQIEAPINRTPEQQEKLEQVQPLEREIPIQFVNHNQSKQILDEKFDIERKPVEFTSKKLEDKSTKRIIPIEFVVSNSERQPIQEECFTTKHHEQLQKSVTSSSPDRHVVREIPIRMVRRPIDQGILCPCCKGSGSSEAFSHGNHKHSSVDGLKKDHQPKNSPTQSILAGNSNRLVNELPNESEPDVKIEDIAFED